MKKHYVITNFPIRLPVQSTILYSFLLYHFNVAGWAWGVFITLYSLLWIALIVIKWNEVRIDINSEKKEDKVKLSKFQEKLAEILKQQKH